MLNINEEVTQAELEVAYKKHKPNAIIRFYYRFFSRDTKDTDKIVRLLAASISGFGVLFGMIGAILTSQIIMTIGALITGSILVPLVGLGFYAFKANQVRIKRICEELGVEPDMYNRLVVKYYEQIIVNDDK